jgi:thymidylate kinase
MNGAVQHADTEVSGNRRTEEAVLPLLRAMLSDFHRHNISYCYWKSSRRVQVALSGEADLDLLIAMEDQHRASAILLQRDFKPFASVSGRSHPSISSFLGYDEPSGRLVHLHLHFRLIVGERLLKNYRVPWESEVLARAIRHRTLPIKVLDRESEALLLIFRCCLELRRTDPMTLRGWAAAKRKFALDREELRLRVDRAALFSLAAELLDADLARMCVRAFYDERAIDSDRRLRRGVQRRFAPYRRYNAVEGNLRKVGKAAAWLFSGVNKKFLHWPRPWGRLAPGGGHMVAVIGLDGSGKSTIVAAIRDWLSTEIDVLPMYFGTGDGRPSLMLLPFKLLAQLAARLIRTKPKGASHGKISDSPPTLLYSLLLMVWATVVAVEKRIKLVGASRGANRGLIVVADRYPQNEILLFNDGPMLPRLKWAPSWLRRFEASAYELAHRLPPDLVIRLEVPPETTARREPDMDPTVIRERIEAIKRLVFPGSRIVGVDARQPLAQVIRAVKREVWRLL